MARVFKVKEQEDYAQQIDYILRTSNIRTYYNTNGYVYVEYIDGPIPDDWIEVTEEEVLEAFGYNPGFVFSEPDDPTPQIPDPTMSQMAAMIVETNLNVEYLVANAQFTAMKGGE